MLVLVPGKVVDSVDISPVPVGWVLSLFDLFPSHDLWSLLSILEFDLFDSASLAERAIKELWITLWVWSVGSVVGWVLLLLFGGVMNDILGPGIFWNGPSAIGLDGKVVLSSNNLNESIFTPVSSPGVSYEPVWGTVFLTESDN